MRAAAGYSEKSAACYASRGDLAAENFVIRGGKASLSFLPQCGLRPDSELETDVGIFVGTHQIGEVRVQGVTLRPTVGAYDLVFALHLNIFADENSMRRASIVGARVTVKPDKGERRPLGFARPEAPFEIDCKPFSSTITPSLHLKLHRGQLAALETLRGSGDLNFELTVSGTGVDENGDQHVYDNWRVRVSHSDWIKNLRDAGARNVMLLEVPLPLENGSGDWTKVGKGVWTAEEQFRNGDYNGCIGSCRTVIQELGHRRLENSEWAEESLKLLGSDRRGMTKDQRQVALWAVLRHYTHQAHLGPSEGGVPAYTRADAQFVLSWLAAAVAHAL